MVNDPAPHTWIAVAAILRKAAAEVEESLKTRFAQANPVKTSLPVVSHRTDQDGERVRLGQVTVNKGRVVFDLDEEQAMPYVLERYGPEAVETIHRITEQYRNSLLAEAKAAYNARPRRAMPPGVSARTGAPYTGYYPDREVDGLAELLEMIRAGELDLNAVLDSTTPHELGDS